MGGEICLNPLTTIRHGRVLKQILINLTIRYIHVNMTIHEAIELKLKYFNTNQDLRKVVLFKFSNVT